jgi:bifunctional non-homologous end joining protein LigD
MTLTYPVAPMKATMGSLPGGDDEGWAYEIKWDGHRTLAHIDGDHVRFQSASGHDVTTRWPDVCGLAEAVSATSAIIDGEMVVIDDDGRPSFDLVQKRLDPHRHPAVFQMFDVLQISGTDAISLAYLDRRRLLSELVAPSTNWSTPAYRIGGGADLLAATIEQRLEGIIAKRIDSIYRPGIRSKDWLKVKNRQRVELVVGGFTTGTGNRSSTFGSLLVGIDQQAATDASVARALTEPLPSSSAVRFAGGVGTGYDSATLDAMIRELRSLVVDESPFDGPVPATVRRTATWVRPAMRIVVDVAEFTNGGIARHASFIEFVR